MRSTHTRGCHSQRTRMIALMCIPQLSVTSAGAKLAANQWRLTLGPWLGISGTTIRGRSLVKRGFIVQLLQAVRFTTNLWVTIRRNKGSPDDVYRTRTLLYFNRRLKSSSMDFTQRSTSRCCFFGKTYNTLIDIFLDERRWFFENYSILCKIYVGWNSAAQIPIHALDHNMHGLCN